MHHLKVMGIIKFAGYFESGALVLKTLVPWGDDNAISMWNAMD